MDSALWFAGEVARRESEQRNIEKSMKTLLKKNKCKDIKQLVEKGKKGEVKTIFPVKNWDTLAWSPGDLGKRPVVPIGLYAHDLNFEKNPHADPLKSKPNHLQILMFIVPPTDNDPNVYSIHYHFKTNSIVLDGVTKTTRLLDLGAITGMSNGVEGFRLSSSDKFEGLHRSTVTYVVRDIKKALAKMETE
jgi:hypothetical protein